MPRRHPHTYRQPNSIDEIADLGSSPREPASIDYRPIVAVIAIVIFSLGMIAFLLSLRMR